MEGGRGNMELMTVESPKFSQTFLYNQHIPSSTYTLQHSPVILKTEEAHSEMSEQNSTAKCKTPQIRPSFEGKPLQTPANNLFCG